MDKVKVLIIVGGSKKQVLTLRGVLTSLSVVIDDLKDSTAQNIVGHLNYFSYGIYLAHITFLLLINVGPNFAC